MSSEQQFFLVIEGVDGSGKTGIARQLQAVLQQTYPRRVHLTFEPHDPSAAGLFIRQVLTQRIRRVSPVVLALAFALNRADHNARIIAPFLEKSSPDAPRIVIGDRYYLSSLVYQAVPPLTMDDVMRLNAHARRPDLTLFLNVTPATAYARMRERAADKELFEKKLGDRQAAYAEAIAYLRARGDTIVEIDANADFPAVLGAALDALHAHGPDWLQFQRPLLAQPQPTPYPADIAAPLPDDAPTAPAAIDDLSQIEAARLFFAYLRDLGYTVGGLLPWSDAPVYALHYDLPGGLTQRGVAVLLDASQGPETTTRLLQAILDGATHWPIPGDMRRLVDFVFVFQPAATLDNPHYTRDHGDPDRPLAPNVQIVTRRTLARHWATPGD